MLVGGIVGWEDGGDDLFNPNSPRNRDDCLAPFRVLRAQALQRNIDLHTIDVLILRALLCLVMAGRYLKNVWVLPEKCSTA